MDQSSRKQYEDFMSDSSKGSRGQYDIDFTSAEDIFDILASDEELEEKEDYIEREPEDDLRGNLVKSVDINIGEEVPDQFFALDDELGGDADVRMEAVDEFDPLLSLEDELEGQAGSGIGDRLEKEMTDHDGDVDVLQQFSSPMRDELENHFEHPQQTLEEDLAAYSEPVDTPEQTASPDDKLEGPFDSSLEEDLAEGVDVHTEHISEPDQVLSANDNVESLSEYSLADKSKDGAGNLVAASSTPAGAALAAGVGTEKNMNLTLESNTEERQEAESAGDIESGESVTPLTRLKELILSIDWEISNDVLSEFTRELNRLKGLWAGEKVNLIYVQAMEKLARYVYVEKGDAHPGALQLLSHLYGNLEKVITSTTLGEAEKKELLKNDVSQFALLKEQIKEGVVGSSSFNNEREDDRQESRPGAVAAAGAFATAGSVIAESVSAASEPATVKKEVATTGSVIAEEVPVAPEPAAVAEEFTAVDSAIAEEAPVIPEPAAAAEEFIAVDSAIAEEAPVAPEPAAAVEEFTTVDSAIAEEVPVIPEPTVVEEEFTTVDSAIAEDAPVAPESVTVAEDLTTVDLAAAEDLTAESEPAVIAEESMTVDSAVAEQLVDEPEPVAIEKEFATIDSVTSREQFVETRPVIEAEEQFVVEESSVENNRSAVYAEEISETKAGAGDFAELSLEQGSDKVGQQSVLELEDDNFTSLPLEDENDRNSPVSDGDEIELSSQQPPVLSAEKREASSLEKRFSFLSDEEALQGVNVDMEADDDMGEEELPRENGELAPALADVFAESSVVDVDSEVEETVSRFFSEEETVTEETLPDKEPVRSKKGVFASGAAALTVFAGSMWKKKAARKKETPLTAEHTPVDNAEESAAVQFSSFDTKEEKSGSHTGAASDYREDDLVTEAADNDDWPPQDEAVAVSDDIFIDVEEPSSAVEPEDDEYAFVLGEEDDDIELQRMEESVSEVEQNHLAEQVIVEEEAAEAVAVQLEGADNDVDALSPSISVEDITEEESATEFDLDFLAEDMAGEPAREEIIDDNLDIVTASSTEELAAEEVDEDWLVLDSPEMAAAELAVDFEKDGSFSLESDSDHSSLASEMAGDSEQRELVIDEIEEGDDLSTVFDTQAISHEDVAMLVSYCKKLQQEKDEELLAEMMMMHNRLIEEMEGHPLELHFLLLFAAVADYLKSHDEEDPLQLMVSVASTLQMVLREEEPQMAQKLLLRESARVLDWFGGLVE